MSFDLLHEARDQKTKSELVIQSQFKFFSNLPPRHWRILLLSFFWSSSHLIQLIQLFFIILLTSIILSGRFSGPFSNLLYLRARLLLRNLKKQLTSYSLYQRSYSERASDDGKPEQRSTRSSCDIETKRRNQFEWVFFCKILDKPGGNVGKWVFGGRHWYLVRSPIPIFAANSYGWLVTDRSKWSSLLSLRTRKPNGCKKL